MKALIYQQSQQLQYQEIAIPQPHADEVIVKVAAAGICGSDMHAFLGHDERRPPPLTLGHEAAGTLDDGRSVIINPLVVCGQCWYCLQGRDNLCQQRQIISMPPRPGAFADYVAMPEQNLLPLPDNLSFQQAAMAEPLACGYHAACLANRHSEVALSDAQVLVIGGGAIGLAAALSLIASRVPRVSLVETNQHRQRFLRHVDGIRLLSTTEVGNAVFDVVIDAVGSEKTRQVASLQVAPGGVIVHIGLAAAVGGLDVRRLTLQNIAVIGSYTYTMAEFKQTVVLMQTGQLGCLDWFETRPLSEGAQAFADLLAGTVEVPKIVLLP